MTTDSPEQLLIEGLQELFYDEQQLVDAMGRLAEETEDERLSSAFEEHRQETDDHVDRLERVFEKLDAQPETRTDEVMDAMLREHEAFASENSGEVLDRYNDAAAQKIEHFEIAAYGNLTSLAGKLGHDEAADLLEETLREEEDALSQVAQASEQFDQQQAADD